MKSIPFIMLLSLNCLFNAGCSDDASPPDDPQSNHGQSHGAEAALTDDPLTNAFNMALVDLRSEHEKTLKKSLREWIYNLQGIADIIEYRSGPLDGFTGGKEYFENEFKVYAFNALELNALLSYLSRDFPAAALDLHLEHLEKSTSGDFKEKQAALLKAFRIKEFSQKLDLYSSSKGLNQAIDHTYGIFNDHPFFKKLAGGLSTIYPDHRKMICAEIEKSLQNFAVSKLNEYYHLLKFPPESLPASESIGADDKAVLTDIYAARCSLRMKRHLSETTLDFIQEKITGDNLEEYMNSFTGLWDGAKFAWKDKEEAQKAVEQNFYEEVFTRESLKSHYYEATKEFKNIFVEETKECAFEIQKTVNPDFVRPKGNLEFLISKPKLPNFLVIKEMVDQIDTTVSVALIIASFWAGGPAGGLWAIVGTVIYEAASVISDATLGDEEGLKVRQEIKSKMTEKLLKNENPKLFGEYRKIITVTFNKLSK
jgi:hypothetical protein